MKDGWYEWDEFGYTVSPCMYTQAAGKEYLNFDSIEDPEPYALQWKKGGSLRHLTHTDENGTINEYFWDGDKSTWKNVRRDRPDLEKPK